MSESILRDINNCLRNYYKFLITTHLRPDGDSIGAEMAMISWLKSLGKKVRVINADPVPQQYLFLPGTSLIEIDNKEKNEDFEVVLALDMGEKQRSRGILEAWKPYKKIINIDHHISNNNFGDINWVDQQASSTSEMVFRLVQSFPSPVCQEMATCLYTGILTDTGSFHFANTQSLTFSIASKLVECGANPTMISEAVYESRSLEQMLALGKLLNSLKTSHDHSIVWGVLDEKVFNSFSMSVDESDWFIDFMRTLRGTKIIILLKKMKDKMYKVSLRSKGSHGEAVDVSRIASRFGGGGHTRAAGCEISGTSENVIRSLLEAIEKETSYAR